MNKESYDDINDVLRKGTPTLNTTDFEKIANDTMVVILDIRSLDDFTQGHIPNAIFIGLDGGFCSMVKHTYW